jgi:Family of unknown function (DUF6732)
MRKSFTLTIAMLTGFPMTDVAQAHLGHVGELAGHSHWIGIGAVAVAAALASLVLQPQKKDGEQETEAGSETDAESGEAAENS